jgi:hypothetical protein
MYTAKSNKYGKGSRKVLATVCPELRVVFTEVLPLIDHSAVDGARNLEQQNALFDKKVSTLRYPQGKHCVGPEAGRTLSDALDSVIWHPKYKALWGGRKQLQQIARDFKVTEARVKLWFYMQYAEFNTLVQVLAVRRGLKIRWGGDWNSINGILDQSFDDFYHWEIVRTPQLQRN